MSTFRNPVGPQPSKVYWRRRLVLALGVLAVIVIVVLIIVRPGSGAPASNSNETPNGTSTETAEEPTNATGDPVACDPAKIVISPRTDAETYDPGINPMLSFEIRSTMTEPCTLPVGTDIQDYRVTSGDELIWSSKDCQTEPVAAEIVLEPNVPQSPAAIPWDRTRSSVDTCAAVREAVVAGGASYHLNVIVGEVESADSKQFILY